MARPLCGKHALNGSLTTHDKPTIYGKHTIYDETTICGKFCILFNPPGNELTENSVNHKAWTKREFYTGFIYHAYAFPTPSI